MKNSEQLDDLITRHFCNELNSDEQALLQQWVSASEENRQYYEELKNTWQLMKEAKTRDEINADKEWVYFQECLEQEGGRNDSAAATGKSGIVRRIVIATAIAATVLFIIALGYNWFGSQTPDKAPVAAEEKKQNEPAVTVRHEENRTDKAEQFVLADSSVIILEPLSAATWNEPFTNNRRDIVLKGKATFQVAKDQTRPFTVISGHIATTALGTRFSVTAFEEDDLITIQLFEGRVVVKPAGSMQPQLKRDYYLQPGEELLYSNKQHNARVRRFTNDNATAKRRLNETHQPADQPLLPVGDKGSWYMFNNQPLAQVFRQLEELYGVQIVYAEKDVEKIYFIGKFSKSDSVGHILKQIATLNNLTINKQNNTYIISR
ncbi:FecR family protein [Longitalea luteola]|uniref:FecR family protein n=1 Tax=Longitalea luteola TaxID=2812563 RepID=UPI001A956792|nr:FecR family protein [Longitalea luteola]